MPNIWTRGLLFLSSYAPLLVILAVRDAFGSRLLAVAFLSLAGLSLIWLIGYLRQARALAPHETRIARAHSQSGEAMNYIVAYLLPFLGFRSASLEDRIALGIFFLVLAIIYISSNLIHMNPMLNLVGYRILEVESDQGKESVLITRRRYIAPGSPLTVVSLSDEVLMEKT